MLMTRGTILLINRYVAFFLLILFLLTGQECTRKSERQELFVAAAVSLKAAFTDIGRQFEAAHPVTITFNFGGSNLLQRQIETGAPADVFASAAEAQMDALQQKNLIVASTRVDFASNEVVLITPADSPLTGGTFQDLATSRIAAVAIGSPEVPVRIYSEEVLRHLGLWDQVLPKGVFGQNTRQVLDYVARGEVDAGLVYATDAAVNPAVRVLAVADPSWRRPIIYPAAVVADSPRQTLAKQFLDFLVSEPGRRTIERYGFRPVP